MKIFYRTSLPEQIKYNGNIYKRDSDKTSLLRDGILLSGQCKGSVIVKVLARKLRGKENLHGKPYQPTQFVYSKSKSE